MTTSKDYLTLGKTCDSRERSLTAGKDCTLLHPEYYMKILNSLGRSHRLVPPLLYSKRCLEGKGLPLHVSCDR